MQAVMRRSVWVGRHPVNPGWTTPALADGVGFEPTRPLWSLPVFKTGAFNRSATHPWVWA
jgi:hypothetical protein